MCPPFWSGRRGHIVFVLSVCLLQQFVHTALSHLKWEFLKTLHACLLFCQNTGNF
jgi:hypothetical protein